MEQENKIKFDEKEEPKNTKQNQSDRLVNFVLRSNITLFRDQVGESFIYFKNVDHYEYWPIRSKKVKSWIAKTFWDKYKKSISQDSINNALNVIEGHASNSSKYDLSNRVSYKDGVIGYDMANDNWEAVKITSIGWELNKTPPILFKRFSHQMAQSTPEKGGDIWQIFDFINVKNKDHKILLLVWIISCFIPDFPHPIIYFYGPQGSAKSTTSKIIRRIIDPSVIEVSELPKDQNQLIQKLSHHWVLIFDNVSYISSEISDLLCRAVSGSGFSKRQLYSDDDDIIYSFKRCLGINGINLISLKPDLMERSILIELERISKEKRTQEQDIFIEFNKELPKIIGSIFTIVSKTMAIKPNIQINYSPRMADFALWGSAISQAMGIEQNVFLTAYQRNIDNQNDEIINENIEASFILDLMKDKNEWIGSATQLLREMRDFYEEDDNIKFPKTPNSLSRKLGELKINLEEAGIKIEITGGRKRKINITKTDRYQENTASVASSLEAVKGDDSFEQFVDELRSVDEKQENYNFPKKPLEQEDLPF